MSANAVTDIVERILLTASCRATSAEAEAAITPILTMLRGSLESMRFDDPPMVFSAYRPTVRAGQSAGEACRLFRQRLNDVANAKRWTDAENVERVIDTVVDDIRAAALGRFQA